jgi:membrane-associated protein
MLTELLHALLALDQTLASIAVAYGPWLYALLFAVIFAETGLVVFPFLPGDSLLFVSGTVVAMSGLNVHALVGALIVAAVTGDSVNHTVGRIIGPKVFDKPDSRWFRQEHLKRTQAFYDKYGGVTIIIGRFVPIVRTFAPFLAGVAGMPYRKFVAFSLAGSTIWISSLVYAGYLFGNIPWVKNNLSLIVVGIVAVSLIPVASTWWRERRSAKLTAKLGSEP